MPSPTTRIWKRLPPETHTAMTQLCAVFRTLIADEDGVYMPSGSTTSVFTNPHRSIRWCQSRPLRASREASIQNTAPADQG